MSYQVFARKYRPQSFDGVVGQDSAVTTLKNAITLSRLHHAYLFCGARGVGKTSLARIFAKSVNCEKGPTATPCQTCTVCQSITTGASFDVLEIDGASNTGVDDVRELREKVKYLPTTGKHKFYIIDEVHMLSQSAFNALLKTLEEPPPHVIFVFATTEPHKIPITILSRCQRFDFKRLTVPQLVGHLKNIAGQEKLNISDEALSLIANCADGSVRDSLSLLDQIVSFCGTTASLDQVREILGLADRALLLEMLEAIIKSDIQVALAQAKLVYEKGVDFKIFAEGLLEMVHHLLLVSEAGIGAVDSSPGEKEIFARLAKETDTARLLILFQILARGVEDLARSDFPRLIFEIILLKMSRSKELLLIPEILDRLQGRGMGDATGGEEWQGPSPSWPQFVKKVIETKPQVGAILEHAAPLKIGDGMISLGFEPKSLYADMLKERISTLEEIALSYFKKPVRFDIGVNPTNGAPITALQTRQAEEQKKTAEVREKAMTHPAIQKAQEMLGARIKEIKEIK